MANKEEIEIASGSLVLVEAHEDSAELRLTGTQRRDRVLLAVFAVVMVISGIYNFVIATPRFGVEFSYVVRTASPSRDRFSFMNFSANGESSDNSEAILAYIRSRDMLNLLDYDGYLSRMFASPSVDMFSAFPSVINGASREELFKHFQSFVTAKYDEKANINYVEVQAFSATDARELAERIKRASEEKINSLNERAQAGMVATAEQEVARAQADLTTALDNLAAIRNRDRVLDPKIETASAVKVTSLSADELAQINVQLDQALRVAPGSSAVDQLRGRRDALKRELARQGAAMAGGRNSLANRIRAYEELAVTRDTAEKRLLGANLALANIRTNADRDRLYLEWISEPTLADTPLYPRAWFNLGLTALLTLAVLWIFRSLSELIFDSHE